MHFIKVKLQDIKLESILVFHKYCDWDFGQDEHSEQWDDIEILFRNEDYDLAGYVSDNRCFGTLMINDYGK